MRYARRADGNQPAVVKALRDIGCSVVCTHTIGQGVPDLIVDYHGRTCLIEIKDPSKPKSDRKLTPAQAEFHAAWTGPIYTVETPEEAVLCVTRLAKHTTAVEKEKANDRI
jgi:hypothetical protein